MSDFDGNFQIRDVFFEEASSLLEEYESQLLALDKSPDKKSSFARLFRVIHTLKGSGASVGFSEFAKFAHAIEDLLSVLRTDPGKFDTEILTVLIAAIDIKRDWLNGLKSGQYASSAPSGATDMKMLIQTAMKRMGSIQTAISKSLNESNVVKSETILNTSGAKKNSRIQPLKNKNDRTQSIVKIDAERLDSVMDLVGELVVIKSQILEDDGLKDQESTRLASLLALLDKNIRDLYDRTLSLRMTSVKALMLKLERTVRDAAMKVGKEVDFEVRGDDCEMDRLLIERIGDPLMHLLRNAVDHGLESVEGRKAAGKPLNGKILIDVSNKGAGILFDIVDDGRGIDRDKVIQKAVENSLFPDVNSAKSLSDAEVYNFLFASGFSTAAKVTDLSGRGVGLDVVKSSVSALKGFVGVSSVLGKGTTFSLKLPTTTAIADGLIVRVANERYIIPLDSVEEVLSLRDASLTKVANQDDCIELHGRFLPLVNLLNEFQLTGGCQELVIVLRVGVKTFAIMVDEIIGQSQVVLKNLHDSLSMSKGVAGTAILGDGRVALVMDVAALSAS